MKVSMGPDLATKSFNDEVLGTILRRYARTDCTVFENLKICSEWVKIKVNNGYQSKVKLRFVSVNFLVKKETKLYKFCEN